MKTDKEFVVLYDADPSKLYELIGKNFPAQGAECRTEQRKEIENTADSTIVPNDPNERGLIVENQGYRAENLHSRALVSSGLFLDRYPDRECEVHLIYLTRTLDPYSLTTSSGRKRKNPKPRPCANFKPHVHYLDERIREIAKTDPDNPLVSVFFPLLERDKAKLLVKFQEHYDNLEKAPGLPTKAREKWRDVFQLWLMRALEINFEQVQKMLLKDLPPVEETKWGKELIEIYRDKGKKEEMEAELKRLEADLAKYDEMKADGILSKEAHRRLVTDAKAEISRIKGKLKG